ncbi:hypothetical protein CCACVL1_15410 [Corchorus capsularis]|uniref:Poly A polymerase head domain-containing protein n=1 Tax=Corchorus capsularis TaxID=210143 RepID=A0A1R3I2J1_COCAP|nr:hypothetical protein CCACVL1_15410 [Corchorus capsularis]
MAIQAKERIELTETEKKVFDRLLSTVRHFNLQTQPRVAGGWVRDKLIGKECHDIDIALDNMLGSEFVAKVKEYLSFVGEEEDAKGIGVIVIQSNPKQSKHLETATMRLFGLSIDFVNLRAIRFGARFDFILDEELKKAAADDDVKKDLVNKISRERIGTEIDLMISGNQPVKAIEYICDLTLFWDVFKFNINLPLNVDPRLCAAYLDATWRLINGGCCFEFDDDEPRRLALYSALFLPLRNATYKDRKGRNIPAVNYILRDSLKRKACDADTVINIHKSLEKFLSLIPSLLSIEGRDQVVDTSKLRVLTGLLLREIKDFWRVALLMSTLLYDPTDDDITNRHFLQLDKRKDLFVSVENAVVKLGLDNVWD